MGVNLIPFSTLRGDAATAAEEVRRRKDEAQIDTNTLRNQKESKLYDIRQLKEKIERKKKEIEDFKKEHPDSATGPLEDEIKPLEKEIEENTAKVKEINEKMAKGLEALEKLAEARARLRRYFDDAKSQLSDLKSNPGRALGSKPSDEDKEKLKEYEENTKKLEEYIRVILGEIEDEEEGHKKQEDELVTARAELKQALEKTE